MEISVTIGVCVTALLSGWLISNMSRRSQAHDGKLVLLMLLAGFATIAVFVLGSK
jgi:hypothetical protein